MPQCYPLSFHSPQHKASRPSFLQDQITCVHLTQASTPSRIMVFPSQRERPHHPHSHKSSQRWHEYRRRFHHCHRSRSSLGPSKISLLLPSTSTIWMSIISLSSTMRVWAGRIIMSIMGTTTRSTRRILIRFWRLMKGWMRCVSKLLRRLSECWLFYSRGNGLTE